MQGISCEVFHTRYFMVFHGISCRAFHAGQFGFMRHYVKLNMRHYVNRFTL